MYEQFLQTWLGVLAIIEAYVIWQAFPLFSNDYGSEYKNLFIFLSGLLSIVRVNCLWDPKSPTAWRALALVHSLEALFYWHTAFYSEQTLPTNFAVWRKDRHWDATLLFGGIVFNAVLSVMRWLELREKEREWLQGMKAKQEVAKAKKASRAGEAKSD